jgi:rubrerythrin
MSHQRPQPKALSFNDLGRIGSTEDLFALALAVEREGVRRYEELHQQMLRLGHLDLAKVFGSLRDQEQDHGDSVNVLAQRTGLAVIPLLSFRWDDLPEGTMPQPITDLTPQLAIRYALRNEQRTYALFLRIAASTHVAEIRHQAELLAKEELDHVALLSRRDLEIEDLQAQIDPHALSSAPPGQRNIDAIRSIAATEAWVSAARRAALAAQLRARGDRWTASLLQDLAENAEARCRSLGVDTPLKDMPRALIPNNDNSSTAQVLEREAHNTHEAVRGFLRMASSLGVNGLAAFINHEANLRLGALALMSDHMASLTQKRLNQQNRSVR